MKLTSDLITIDEAAELLSLARNTIKQYISSGVFPVARRIGRVPLLSKKVIRKIKRKPVGNPDFRKQKKRKVSNNNDLRTAKKS